MKILQIAPQVPYPPNDGGRISIYNITKFLSKRGHTIDFVCYLKNSDYDISYKAMSEFSTPYLLPVDTKDSLLGAIKNLVSPVPYNISKFRNRELELFLHDYFANNTPDIVHVDHLHLAWVIDVIRKLSPVPVVLRQHNIEGMIMQRFYEKQTNPLLKLFAYLQHRKFVTYEPATCRKFDVVATITGADEQFLLNQDEKIKTIAITAGINSELLSNEPAEQLIPYSLFHIGSLKWLPNIDALEYFFAEIFPIVLKKHPGTKLYVYGEGAEQIRIPTEFRSAVEIVGYVENIWQAIADKQVGIAPLRIGGGMRLKVIELMAAGKLLVSTSVAKEGIAVVDGVNGLVADTPEDFANKIDDCFTGKIDSTMIIEKGRELTRNEYTWETIAEKFENTYMKAVAKRK